MYRKQQLFVLEATPRLQGTQAHINLLCYLPVNYSTNRVSCQHKVPFFISRLQEWYNGCYDRIKNLVLPLKKTSDYVNILISVSMIICTVEK